MESLPLEIWMKISCSLRPNPITLCQYSLVCRSLRQIFTSDQIWEPFNVYAVENCAAKFCERANALSDSEQALFRDLWLRRLTVSPHFTTKPSLDFLLAFLMSGLPWTLPQVTDRHLAVCAIKARCKKSAYLAMDKQLQRDKQLVILAINYNPRAIRFIDRSFSSDPDVVMAVVRLFGPYIKYASPELKADREIAMTAVLSSTDCDKFGRPHALTYIADNLKDDFAFMTQAVQNDGSCLVYGSPRIRSNREVVLTAITQGASALGMADPSLKEDKEFMIEVLRVCPKKDLGQVQGFTPVKLRQDLDYVLAVVQRDGTLLGSVARRFRGNREVVLAAVKNDGSALQFAPPELRADPGVVFAAVSQCGMALQFADPALCLDRDIVIAAVTSNAKAIKLAKPFINDPGVLDAALANDIDALSYFSLQSDIENPGAFSHLPDPLDRQQEAEVVETVHEESGNIFNFDCDLYEALNFGPR